MNGDYEAIRGEIMDMADQSIDEHTEDPNEKNALKLEIHNLLDSLERTVYKKAMEDFYEAADYDFIKHRIAVRYGVDVSEVTSEFLSAKIKECDEEVHSFFRRYEKERGVKLIKDTPEHRDVMLRKFESLVNS